MEIYRFFDFDEKLQKNSLRVINGYTTITSHNESFKALTKLRNILSVWSQIQRYS